MKLLTPVAILSVAINIPKFFETYPVTVSMELNPLSPTEKVLLKYF